MYIDFLFELPVFKEHIINLLLKVDWKIKINLSVGVAGVQ